jgi:hypothetical protein
MPEPHKPPLPQRLASLLLAHAFLALTLALSWWAPTLPFASSAGDARWIMGLESVLLFASILVGGFVQVAYVAFPVILLATIGWLMSAGKAGLSLATASFVWGVSAAFYEGLRAHRGEFGFARENPAHPHRRYDRVALIYVATLPVPLVCWLAGNAYAWSIWGSVYFTLQALGDSVLRDPIDKIPRALLKRMQANVSPEVAARLGICRNCLYVQPALPPRPGRDVRCVLSIRDKNFPEYPETPVTECAGWRKRD